MVNDDAIAAVVFPYATDASDNPGWLHRTDRMIRGGASNVPETVLLQEDLRGKRRFPSRSWDLMMIFTGSGATIEVNGIVRVLVLKS